MYTSEETDLTGAEAVAAVLARAGVRFVFGYPGTSELALCDAIERAHHLSLVNGHGDKECAFMAAGASLFCPNRGVAILHGARGLSNAAGALADVRRSELGTMFLVGLPSTASAPFLPPHSEPNLIGTMATFAGWAWEAAPVPEERPARLVAANLLIQKLWDGLQAAARLPCKPVLFGLPQDVAERCWVPRSLVSGPPVSGLASPIEEPVVGIDLAARTLETARRPLFLIDDYALRYNGFRHALDDLSRRVGGAVLQVRYRRGAMLFERLRVVDVQNFLGWFDPSSFADQALLNECDVLVTVEDRNMYPRVVGGLPSCPKVAITSDSRKVMKNGYLRSGDTLVEGDPVTILNRLATLLTDRREGFTWFHHHAAVEHNTSNELSYEVNDGRAKLADALGAVLARWQNPLLVDDSQMFGGLLSDHYDKLPVGLRVFGGHGGFVGAGIAQAIGQAIANDQVRVMCTLGDEGFINGFQGLVAAMEHQARVMFVVCNNGGSVSLQKQAQADLGPRIRGYLTNKRTPSYQAIATAIGIPAVRVEVPIGSPRQNLDTGMARAVEALSAAGAISGPSLVELVLPADQAVWRGIWSLDGFEAEGHTS